MRVLITLTVTILMIFFVSVKAKSDDYTKAVIGHVVQSKLNGTNVDHSKLMEQEMERIGHQFALQMVTVMQKYLPYIMDRMMTDMRLELDKQHKCLLLKDSKIKDKDCK